MWENVDHSNSECPHKETKQIEWDVITDKVSIVLSCTLMAVWTIVKEKFGKKWLMRAITLNYFLASLGISTNQIYLSIGNIQTSHAFWRKVTRFVTVFYFIIFHIGAPWGGGHVGWYDIGFSTVLMLKRTLLASFLPCCHS